MAQHYDVLLLIFGQLRRGRRSNTEIMVRKKYSGGRDRISVLKSTCQPFQGEKPGVYRVYQCGNFGERGLTLWIAWSGYPGGS